MIIIVGLVILVVALIVGVAGVLGNAGSAHPLVHFAVFGYHVSGSTGTLFLSGIVVGAVGILGLALLLAGARRTSRRGHEARRGLRQSRLETAVVTKARDNLIDERVSARAAAAESPVTGAVANDSDADQVDAELSDGRQDGRHTLASRFAAWRAPAQPTAISD